ncbi:MAG: hypothetical protein HY599_00560 [Candidatus Omnitrophica bacterium]|nr:hypothetical protein [Candidatus Omnitrophota bacterium]
MRDRESGFVLLAALMVLIGAVSLGAAGLSRSLIEMTAAERFIDKQQAFQQAEAAVDDALATLTADPNLALPYTMPTSTTTSSAVLGSKTYTITDLGNSRRRLSATGTMTGGVAQTIEVVVEVPAPALFQQALFGEDNLHIHQGILIDSYDSTLGAYTPAPDTTNRNANGHLRTNSTDPGAIQLDQNVHIAGDVLVGSGGVPSVVIQQASGVQIDGQPDDMSNLTLTAIETPPGTPCGSALTIPQGTTQTIDISGGFCYSSVTVEKNASLTITGDGQITLGDNAATDLSVATDGALEFTGTVTVVAQEIDLNALQLDAAAKLTVYAASSLEMRGVINASEDPKTLSILYSGTDAIDLGQDSAFYGTIYAPDAEVDLHQSGDVYGAIIAKSVKFDQGGRLHFDEALMTMNVDGSTGSQPRIISWRQP